MKPPWIAGLLVFLFATCGFAQCFDYPTKVEAKYAGWVSSEVKLVKDQVNPGLVTLVWEFDVEASWPLAFQMSLLSGTGAYSEPPPNLSGVVGGWWMYQCGSSQWCYDLQALKNEYGKVEIRMFNVPLWTSGYRELQYGFSWKESEIPEWWITYHWIMTYIGTNCIQR